MKPSRHFIGPLTPSQQAYRSRVRDRYREIAEIMDARYIGFQEAAAALKYERLYRSWSMFPERSWDTHCFLNK